MSSRLPRRPRSDSKIIRTARPLTPLPGTVRRPSACREASDPQRRRRQWSSKDAEARRAPRRNATPLSRGQAVSIFETVWSGLAVSHPVELVEIAKVLETKASATDIFRTMALAVRDQVLSGALLDALNPFLVVPELWATLNSEAQRASVGLPAPDAIAQSVLTWAEDDDLLAAAWQQVNRGETAGLGPIMEELAARDRVNQPDANGETLASCAVRVGNGPVRALLQRYGAHFPSSSGD